MTDRISRERRSWNMSQIRGANTRPEMVVRSVLHRLGYRFRVHSPKLPGRPDVVLPMWRTVIQVHGCFWHRHCGCKFAYMPKSRLHFWTKKFTENIERDLRTGRQLRELGWRVVTVWECQVRDPERLAKRLDARIKM
jgi:DNA mismatch endonuclease, patch repair protein